MPEKTISLWRGTAAPQRNYPSLQNDLTVDVSIVGGGLAGMMACYYLNKAGITAAVLEDNYIASGTSGNTTAKVTSFHDPKYNYLLEKFGNEAAQIYADSNQWAINELEVIAFQERADCDFLRTPLNIFALSDKGLEKLKREFIALKSVKIPASYHQKDERVPFPMKGEIRIENQALFDPKKFITKIAETLTMRGALMFEQTRVRGIEDGDTVVISTGDHVIRSKNVIIATNYPVYDKAFLFLRMNQIRSYALAARVNSPISKEMYIAIDDPGLYLRPHFNEKGEWIVISGEDHITASAKEHDPYRLLEEKLKKYYDVLSIDYKWAAQDSNPIDRVPFIGKMPGTKNVYVTTGFGEWGMTNSLVSGKILADLIAGNQNDWASLYSPDRVKPFASLKNTCSLLKHVVKRFGAKFIPFEKYNPVKVSAGEGKIFSHNGEKIAVYKTEEGSLKILSAN